jgi:glutamine synthetase
VIKMNVFDEIITSRQNNIVKWAASLSEKKNRVSERSFIAEGEKLRGEIEAKTAEIEAALSGAKKHTSNLEKANAYKNEILTLMSELRTACDEMEKFTAKELWPMPSYGDLLFGVQ